MTHCTRCGDLITRGRDPEVARPAKAVTCLLCEVAQQMTTFRYVSPAMKRWNAKKEHAR